MVLELVGQKTMAKTTKRSVKGAGDGSTSRIRNKTTVMEKVTSPQKGAKRKTEIVRGRSTKTKKLSKGSNDENIINARSDIGATPPSDHDSIASSSEGGESEEEEEGVVVKDLNHDRRSNKSSENQEHESSAHREGNGSSGGSGHYEIELGVVEASDLDKLSYQ